MRFRSSTHQDEPSRSSGVTVINISYRTSSRRQADKVVASIPSNCFEITVSQRNASAQVRNSPHDQGKHNDKDSDEALMQQMLDLLPPLEREDRAALDNVVTPSSQGTRDARKPQRILRQSIPESRKVIDKKRTLKEIGRVIEPSVASCHNKSMKPVSSQLGAHKLTALPNHPFVYRSSSSSISSSTASVHGSFTDAETASSKTDVLSSEEHKAPDNQKPATSRGHPKSFSNRCKELPLEHTTPNTIYAHIVDRGSADSVSQRICKDKIKGFARILRKVKGCSNMKVTDSNSEPRGPVVEVLESSKPSKPSVLGSILTAPPGSTDEDVQLTICGLLQSAAASSPFELYSFFLHNSFFSDQPLPYKEWSANYAKAIKAESTFYNEGKRIAMTREMETLVELYSDWVEAWLDSRLNRAVP